MSEWIRVSKVNKCPICGHDSWCTYNAEVIICMRTSGGREKTFKDGTVGWLHRLGDPLTVALPYRLKPKPEVRINATKLMAEFARDTDPASIEELAEDLGVSPSSLRDLGCAWAAPYRAYAFPMFDRWGHIVGIRLRSKDGSKFAVTGSHQGIFVGGRQDYTRRCFVLEGPTDTAAAMTIGLHAVGRPSCAGGMPEILHLVRDQGMAEVVIVSDNDEVGRRGAMMLQGHLPCRSVIMLLPAKDMREFVRRGGDRDDLDELLGNLIWQVPVGDSAQPAPGSS